MKVKAISRQTLSRRTGDVHRVDRNPTPELHPFERAREYTRALNATKLERVFAKPFLGALDDHKDGVFSMATHPQTLSTIYSGACDGELKCWNLASRKQAWSVNAHRGFVRGIAPSRNGEIIVSCSNDKTVKLWRVSSAFADPNNVKPIKTILGSMPFMAIDHHWFDSSFATASTVVDIWDHQRDEAVQSFEWGADSIHCVRFNRTETNVLASCGSDRSITLYDVRLKSAIRKLVLQMSSNSIQWNPMEAFNFTVANEDHNLYAFDMRKLDIARNIYKGHVGAVMCLDYAPTGREIVSGSYDHSVRIFAQNEGSSREVYTARRMQKIFDVKYSADNRFVLTGSDDTNLRIWKARASETLDALLPRQSRQQNYNAALQKRFKHVPSIKRIARHRHVPKSIHNAKRRVHESMVSSARKQSNVRAHAKPGTHSITPARQAFIVEQQE